MLFSIQPHYLGICIFNHVFFSELLTATWLQRETSQPADVHWDSRRSSCEGACILSGAPDNGENCGHSEPGDVDRQHQNPRDSSSS